MITALTFKRDICTATQLPFNPCIQKLDHSEPQAVQLPDFHQEAVHKLDAQQ